MRSRILTPLMVLALLPCLVSAQNITGVKPVIKDLPFQKWAPTPPMGWNSWDCFAITCTESQAKAQIDYMAMVEPRVNLLLSLPQKHLTLAS